MKKLLVALSVGLVLQGCYSTPKFQAQANDNQTLTNDQKTSSELSEPSHLASIEMDKYINGVFDKPAFRVIVANKDKQPLAISIDDIQVYADGKQIALLDPKSVQADRARTAKHLTSNIGNRGSRSVNRGPVIGHTNLSYIRNPAISSGNKSLVSYGTFISSQLDKAVVKPNNIYTGYVTLNVDDLNGVENFKVVMQVDSQEHIFNVVRN